MLSRRQLLRRAALYTPLVYAALNRPRRAYGAAIVAANASLTAVQAAVNAAQNGDTVLIPNGSATWSSPLNIGGKRIIIRAQNYTPTAQPTPSTVRNVVITYTGTTDFAMDFTSGNDFHCGVGGIEFRPPHFGQQGNQGSGIWGFVHFAGSGNKPPLLFDCRILGNERQGVTAGEAAFVSIDSLGAVVWNTILDGTLATTFHGQPGLSGAGIHISSPRAWATASTMGTLDVGGLVNVYVEDCRQIIWGQADVDTNGRLVVRRTIQDGCSWQTHGFTSGIGGRFIEQYDCTLQHTFAGAGRDMVGRAMWLRAGTTLVTGCVANIGGNDLVQTGDNTNPQGSYPVNFAVARGHNGSAHVADPIYIWGNTGPSAQNWGHNQDPSAQGWIPHVQLNRDIFVSGNPGTPKPSTPGSPGAWQRFTYPHPLRSVVEDGALSPAPAAPTGLTIG